jgi:hypothetical protein
MTAAIGIQIGIGTEIDEKARNSTPDTDPDPDADGPISKIRMTEDAGAGEKQQRWRGTWSG